MSMKNSYFALPSVNDLLERWFNPEITQIDICLRDKPLTVSWTHRAERMLSKLEQPILVEMQLYFSCVVKKRVLFHSRPPEETIESVRVTPQLCVAFRPVEANSCDPEEFAAYFPVRREFVSPGAIRMHPSRLRIDHQNGNWVGEFSV